MNPDGQLSWSVTQKGRVSVTHQRLRDIVKNQVHIECDCQSNSLLSDIARDFQRDSGSWMKRQLGLAKVKAGNKQDEAGEKTQGLKHFLAELKNDELLVTKSDLTLQGEALLVRDGVPYSQSKSLVSDNPSASRPVLSVSKVDREAMETKQGPHKLYDSNSDSHERICRDTQIHSDSEFIPFDMVANKQALARCINADELRKIVPNIDKLSNIKAVAGQSVQETGNDIGRLNQVVLLNCICVLSDNKIIVLRGLLHAGIAWHRVINGTLVGSDNSLKMVISGRAEYKNESSNENLLLSGVTLYSIGNTIYAHNTPLLEDAVLHADGQEISISGLPMSSMCGFPAPKEPQPARLFLLDGRFSVRDTEIRICEGTVLLQDLSMQLPDGTGDEVRVKDSLVFIGPTATRKEAEAYTVACDIIYKDNMLLLGDLTPLLKAGLICHAEQRQPLAWLSGDPEAAARARNSDQLEATPETLTDRVQMLSEGTCILDRNGMYFIRGKMILQGNKVLIDHGVPLFSAETSAEVRRMYLGTPPPYLSGRVLLSPDEARSLGIETLNGYVVLKDAHLDMTSGKIILNNQVPVMSDCRLVMDRHVLSPMELGFDAEKASPENAKETVSASQKTIVSATGMSTADQEDSGRGTSEWAESSQHAASSFDSATEAAKLEKTNSDRLTDESGLGLARDSTSMGDFSSQCMLGNIQVFSSHKDKKLVFSIKSHLDQNFLDTQV